MRRALTATALLFACDRSATLGAGAVTAAPALHDTRRVRDTDPDAVARITAMTQACQRATVTRARDAAGRAMDTVRMTLGSFCSIETVGGDALHWRVRCDANAFFDLGRFQLRESPEAMTRCPNLNGALVDRWSCAGAVLRDFVQSDGTLELVTVGHVDHVALSQSTTFAGCEALGSAVSFSPERGWFAPATAATAEDRTRGNEQLAWCRAAQVARAVRCGMALRQRGAAAPPAGCDALSPAEVFGPSATGATTVLGAGTAWMDRHTAACSPGVALNGVVLAGQCPEARRVDVMVRLVPRELTVERPCVVAENDPAGALGCLQRCLEAGAVNVRGNVAEQVPLTAACGTMTALPPSWMRAPALTPGAQCRSASIPQVRDTLEL